MSNKKSVEDKVVEAIESVEKDDNLIRLSTGVVLRGRPAPALALIKVMANFKMPEIPSFRDEKIGRDIPNPDDPTYRKALQSYEATSSSALLNTLIIYGTQVDSVPKKFQKHTDDAWVDKLASVDLPTRPENDNWRYLNWVLFEAAPEARDMEVIQKVVGKLSGVPEKAVQDAETFPGSDADS